MIKRILGSETEFGVTARSPELLDPVSASLLLVNQYPSLPSPSALWDYEQENPLLDARGFEVEGEREKPGPDYNRMLNKVLANGGRLYVDGAHPEYSTPECTNARDLLRFERAGDLIAEKACAAAKELKGGEGFILYRNNSDGKGNSYGYHENYLVDRALPFDTLMRYIIPFFVTRLIFTGSGKVGSENRSSPVDFQVSQRADFFETVVDLNTMVKRPIINTRDEPHSDPTKYRRFHVIVGDANMAELSTYLKVGTTVILLTMIEEGWSLPEIEIQDPVRAIKSVSRDIHLKESLLLTDGRRMTPIEIQREFYEAAVGYSEKHEMDEVSLDVIKRWGDVLDRLQRDPMKLSRELDWVIKLDMMQKYMERKGCAWQDARIAMMDLQYHDVRSAHGLYYSLERDGYVKRILSDEEISTAEMTPPDDTRAYFRGACLKKFPREIYGASWSSILFDTGNTTIKKIPLLEPLRGTRELAGPLIDSSETVKEILDRLVV